MRLIVVAALLLAPTSHALELSGSVSGMQLPATFYHFRAYTATLGFGKPKNLKVLEAGLMQPYSLFGYRHQLYFVSFTWNYSSKPKFIQPYIGAGLGAYYERVSSAAGFVPSVTTRAGLKIGSKAFGVVFSNSIYIGMYNPLHLIAATVWPLFNVSGGIYLAI